MPHCTTGTLQLHNNNNNKALPEQGGRQSISVDGATLTPTVCYRVMMGVLVLGIISTRPQSEQNSTSAAVSFEQSSSKGLRSHVSSQTASASLGGGAATDNPWERTCPRWRASLAKGHQIVNGWAIHDPKMDQRWMASSRSAFPVQRIIGGAETQEMQFLDP